MGSRDRHVIGFFVLFVYLQDRNNFTLKLEDTENWLYEDGEDQPKQVYVDKLAELKVSDSEPLVSRVELPTKKHWLKMHARTVSL